MISPIISVPTPSYKSPSGTDFVRIHEWYGLCTNLQVVVLTLYDSPSVLTLRLLPSQYQCARTNLRVYKVLRYTAPYYAAFSLPVGNIPYGPRLCNYATLRTDMGYSPTTIETNNNIVDIALPPATDAELAGAADSSSTYSSPQYTAAAAYSVWCYAISGADIAFGATPCPVELANGEVVDVRRGSREEYVSEKGVRFRVKWGYGEQG
eukprot:2787715-Rhodomonas_salina.1